MLYMLYFIQTYSVQ